MQPKTVQIPPIIANLRRGNRFFDSATAAPAFVMFDDSTSLSDSGISFWQLLQYSSSGSDRAFPQYGQFVNGASDSPSIIRCCLFHKSSIYVESTHALYLTFGRWKEMCQLVLFTARINPGISVEKFPADPAISPLSVAHSFSLTFLLAISVSPMYGHTGSRREECLTELANDP